MIRSVSRIWDLDDGTVYGNVYTSTRFEAGVDVQ